jgi:hypothetical protein
MHAIPIIQLSELERPDLLNDAYVIGCVDAPLISTTDRVP